MSMSQRNRELNMEWRRRGVIKAWLETDLPVADIASEFGVSRESVKIWTQGLDRPECFLWRSKAKAPPGRWAGNDYRF